MSVCVQRFVCVCFCYPRRYVCVSLSDPELHRAGHEGSNSSINSMASVNSGRSSDAAPPVHFSVPDDDAAAPPAVPNG